MATPGEAPKTGRDPSSDRGIWAWTFVVSKDRADTTIVVGRCEVRNLICRIIDFQKC